MPVSANRYIKLIVSYEFTIAIRSEYANNIMFTISITHALYKTAVTNLNFDGF